MNADPKQPLYVAPEERVTLDQLKARVERISDLAVAESKRVANEVREENLTKVVLVAAGVVVVALSVAYFLGSRSARRSAAPEPPRGY